MPVEFFILRCIKVSDKGLKLYESNVNVSVPIYTDTEQAEVLVYLLVSKPMSRCMVYMYIVNLY